MRDRFRHQNFMHFPRFPARIRKINSQNLEVQLRRPGNDFLALDFSNKAKKEKKRGGRGKARRRGKREK